MSHKGWHFLGWLVAALISFSQPWGKVAADTKLDLMVDPVGFLRQATHAYTDLFTLGQLQNQAYGYLFPQGAFFAATDFLPDWVAQRLWWVLVLGVGYSGALRVAHRVGLHGPWAGLAAFAYALSPRVLTTLTAISSETWPVMLAPWVLAPFLGARLDRRAVAAALIPVALMGAVNATATMAACLPAAVVLAYRAAWRPLLAWLAGCALVSAWWLGPLFILGSYSPPFTDYIESAAVTTRWLNLAEILRGATSWAPFVDNERTAGTLLVTAPAFVLLTALAAALGLAGLHRAPRVWTAMLLTGVAVLGCHYGFYVEFLDGAGAALRNVHKFDPLVRLPLALGIGFALSRTPSSPRRRSALVLAVLVVLASASPALTGRMLPRGTWEEIDADWVAAADFLNEHAAGTRTLIYPERSFAREDWGWTRDEPAQPLLDVPWAVRDAIPLVPAESIRGLDGVMAALCVGRTQALERLGIGALVVRDAASLRAIKGGQRHRFGELTVILLDQRPDLLLTADAPTRVAGGGEALAFVDGPTTLVQGNAQVVTDTPLLVDRNYGTLDGAVSAPLSEADPSTVRNRARDYASAGNRVSVREEGGHVAASSSAADSDALGGADPARSVTAAVDSRPDTAWWPAPGDTGWLEFQGQFPARSKLKLSATAATTVTVASAGARVEVLLAKEQSKTITVPGGATTAIRVELTQRVGLNAQLVDNPVTRVVTVPDTSPDVEQFIFQQLLVDTDWLIREFTAPRQMEVTLDANRWVTIDGKDYYPSAKLTLAPGTHRIETKAKWVTLSTAKAAFGTYEPVGREVGASESPRLLVTGRAYNAGLRASLGGVELEPVTVDADTQAFRVPAGAHGTVELSFTADPLYRALLIAGAIVALLSVAACLWVLSTRAGFAPWRGRSRRLTWMGLAVAALGGPAVLAGVLAGWAAARWTTLRADVLSGGLMAAAGAILARGAWGSGHYAGDFWLTTFFAAAALGTLLSHRAAGSSTQ